MKLGQRGRYARFLGVLFLCIFSLFGASCKGRAWDDSGSPIPVSSKDPMWGNRDAKVTLVLYSDFQCPFCQRLTKTMDELKVAYSPKDLRIVWKNEPLPFHPNAKAAAEAGAGVMELKGSAAFWKFHDHAFKNQQGLNEDNFLLWAKDAGVTSQAFKAGLHAHRWAGKVDTDHDEAKRAGVSGTPCAFVNGVRVSGAVPFDRWKTVIDEELTKADAEIRSGSPRNQLYVTLSTRNKRAEPPVPSVPVPSDAYKAPDSTIVHDVPVGTSPVLGNPKAPVTLVVFADFQCPFCKRIESTYEELRKTYGSSIRFVWKNNPLPFHKDALPAAHFALEARAQKGDQTFWAAHDLLFGDQRNLNTQTFETYAKQLGLDVNKTMAAVRDEKWKSVIDADKALAVKLEATGTPATFINGRYLSGAQPYERFKTIIDEELQKSKGGGLGVQGGAVQPKVNLAP